MIQVELRLLGTPVLELRFGQTTEEDVDEFEGAYEVDPSD